MWVRGIRATFGIGIGIGTAAMGGIGCADVPLEEHTFEIGPGPWDDGVFLPSSAQKRGNAEAGYTALLNEDYISCGIPLSMWDFAGGALGGLGDGDKLPGRVGKNADMPYDWNVSVAKSGVEIVTQNCLGCHAGSFNGELVLGLGTADADFTADPTEGTGGVPDIPGPEGDELKKFLSRARVMGPETVMFTVGTNPAEMMAVSLMAHRDPETLEWSDEPLVDIPPAVVPSDPPPWWRSHKKNALFYNGMARGDHRGTMLLATSVCTDTVEELQEIDSYFHHVQEFVRSVRAPLYPFPIDRALADEGRSVFMTTCAGCHGTYAEDESAETYPNLLIPLSKIGTDPVVAIGGLTYADHVERYNRSFYGQITPMVVDVPISEGGYMPPPLDGIWATGPFLHNGSVPTIELVLNSAARPTYWKREDFDSANFDEDAVGWPFEELPYGQDGAPADDRKFVYDTTLLAHSNRGHIYGDHLSVDERRALLEYLKTL